MWTKEVAKIWTNYVPPCRPSRFELDLISKKIEEVKSKQNRKINILILGSTTEYRELAFEEYCNTTVIDNSIEYHEEISKEVKYTNKKETLVILNWQDINFQEEFDIIVGNLVIGNLKESEIDKFLSVIFPSLRDGGYFITKSFFYDHNKPIIPPSVFFKEYEKKYSHFDPFPFNAYNLTLYCMNKQSFIMNFHDMYLEVKENFEKNIITKNTYDRYLNFGWQETLKTEFYVMPKYLWEEKIKLNFSQFQIEYAPYFWALDFPIYIIKK